MERRVTTVDIGARIEQAQRIEAAGADDTPSVEVMLEGMLEPEVTLWRRFRDGTETRERLANSGELRGLMNQRISHVLGRRPKLYPFLMTLR